MRKTIVAVLLGVVCSSPFTTGASAQLLAVPIPQQVDPLLKGLTIPASAPSIGMWSPPPASNPQYNWPLVAMHSAVMPDGRVVTFGSPLDTTSFTQLGEVFDIWNPRQGFTINRNVSHRTLDNITHADNDNVKIDSFCAASILLRTGELLTSGGNTKPVDYSYNNATSVVNTSRNKASGAKTMASSRYYATQTMLADGRVLITGGSVWGADPTHSYDQNPGPWGLMSGAPEVYTPGPTGGSWETLTGAGAGSVSQVGAADAFGPRDNKWWYPRQWVSPADGQVFGISTHQMWYLDPAVQPSGAKGSIALLNTFKSGVGTSDRYSAPNVGATSTAVMYDVGKILQVGGNGRLNGDTLDLGHEWTPSSNAASIFDINTAGQVQWRDALNPMTYYRHWANATVLPNGKVVVTGGTGTGNKATPDTPADPGLGPIHHAEIWDPVSEAWTLGPMASVARVYHSTAVLLANGTVLTAGSGGPAGGTPNSPAQYNAEVYYPAYLFQTVNNVAVPATRPRILSMNARKFTHGALLQAQVSVDAANITKAVLIGLGSVTHSFDMGQRLYPVPTLSQSGTQVSFSLPDANKTPPGYYYLFVLQNGVPSAGVIIAIGLDVAPPPNRVSTPLDYDGDGKADYAYFRQANGWFFYAGSASNYSNGGSKELAEPYGGEVPLTGDYDGDGKADFAHFQPGYFVYASSENGNTRVEIPFASATSADVPLAGDYDGDGKTDPAYFRPGNGWFFYLGSASNYTTGGGMQYAYPGGDDVPLGKPLTP